MPKVSVSVPHTKPVSDIVERVKPAIDKTIEDFQGEDVQIEWSDQTADFSFKSMSFTIKGHVQVDDSTVAVEVDLPFAAMMFKDRAQKAITKNVVRALEG